MPTVPDSPTPVNPVTALDLAALAHTLRLELADLRVRQDDLLAAHRAAFSDVWEKLAQLECRVGQLGG
jgi:hypothetical protein